MFLKKSTEVIVPIGPLVDATDGATLETAVALASGEALLLKAESGTIVNIGTNTWSSHLGGGMYNLTLTASNTDTLGRLDVVVYDTAHRPVRSTFFVVEANVFDAIKGSDYLKVDAMEFNSVAVSGFLNGSDSVKADTVKINGSASAAERQSSAALGIVKGTVATGSTVTSIVASLTEATNDHYNGRSIVFISGNLDGQAATISDYNGAAKTFTVSALTEAPANGDLFVIV